LLSNLGLFEANTKGSCHDDIKGCIVDVFRRVKRSSVGETSLVIPEINKKGKLFVNLGGRNLEKSE
jgi:hypothetical protein